MIDDHHDGFGLAETMNIIPLDEPGSGGAHHEYAVEIDGVRVAHIQFQHGPRDEEGSKPGILGAVLVAILLDQLRAYQAGPFSSRENSLVITKLEEALMWMQQRARNRAKRGVLGKSVK